MQTSDASKIFGRINKSKIIFLIDIDFEKKKKKAISQINFRFHNIFDLLREKGPTAVKCRFKTQLIAFFLQMLRNTFIYAS